ncbi:hypothetical protein FPQ18DRAFT_303517 [Pyronema domesticum]|nr:hypothetical protein FPQ18DRAFT_303517 [Pyronema domesticum]
MVTFLTWSIIEVVLLLIYAILDCVIQLLPLKRRTDTTRQASKARKWRTARTRTTGICWNQHVHPALQEEKEFRYPYATTCPRPIWADKFRWKRDEDARLAWEKMERDDGETDSDWELETEYGTADDAESEAESEGEL